MPYPQHIPPFLLWPTRATREATVRMLGMIDACLQRLARLGLQPHPRLLAYPGEVQSHLERGGPCELRRTPGFLRSGATSTALSSLLQPRRPDGAELAIPE